MFFTSYGLNKNDLYRNCSYEWNSQVTRTRINVNGRHWNACILVFTETHIRVLGLTLVSMWTHPNIVLIKTKTLVCSEINYLCARSLKSVSLTMLVSVMFKQSLSVWHIVEMPKTAVFFFFSCRCYIFVCWRFRSLLLSCCNLSLVYRCRRCCWNYYHFIACFRRMF